MNENSEKIEQISKVEKQSTLDGLPSQTDLLQKSIKIRPAQFAKICNVSKQSVSTWIKKGLITIDSQGLLDPRQAAESFIKKSDPSRVKANVFKAVTNDVSTLQTEIKRLNDCISELKTNVKALETELKNEKIEVQDWNSEYFDLLDNCTKGLTDKLMTDKNFATKFVQAVIDCDRDFLETQLDDFFV